MKSALVLLTGSLLASAALQAAADARYPAILYRGKYGRSLPAEVSEPKLKKETALPAPACCLSLRGHDHLTKRAVMPVREDYFRAKYGTNSPVEEARPSAVTQELAAHRRTCVELGQCSQMVAHAQPLPRIDAAASDACEHACCR